MKRISVYLLSVVIVLLFISFGCRNDSEPFTVSTYVYKNSSTTTITVSCYSVIMKDGIEVESKKSSFIIPVGEIYELKYYNDMTTDHRDPLYLFDNPQKDSVIISNTKKYVIEREWEEDKIYFQENYEVISEYKNRKTFQFVFTDSYFENGYPIE